MKARHFVFCARWPRPYFERGAEEMGSDKMGKKKSPVAIALSVSASTMNVDGIEEHVAFIKINRLFPRCVSDAGVVDSEHVKDVVRAMWRIDNVREREGIQYLFALYKGRIFGVYHVLRVSCDLATENRAGLPDFPSFPEDVRECDRWKARFATIEQAKQTLTPSQYDQLIANLTHKDPSPQHALKLHRKRVYFSVDDNVPKHLLAYVGCEIERTTGLGGDILKDTFHSVIVNF